MRTLLSTCLGGLLAMNMSLPAVHAADTTSNLWNHDNLFAWCAVPFDAKARGPEDRAAMLEQLGFKMFAYDWRAKDIPTFDAEIEALQKHNIKLTAWWFPASAADPSARQILEVCKRHDIHPQLWVANGGPFAKTPEEQKQRIEGMASQFKALDALAKPYGCAVEIYNHNGWGGNLDNALAVIARLKEMGVTGVGLVYNFSHAHDGDHDDSVGFPELWKRIEAQVVAVNVAGMNAGGGEVYPSQGVSELAMMRTIQASGWKGPVGLIAEQGGDAAITLENCLKGLDWLAAEINRPGQAGAKPVFRSSSLTKASAAPAAVIPVAATGSNIVPDGHFGKALDATSGGMTFPNSDDIRHGPITVELWTRLHDAAAFNILVASDPKSSGDHWELYTYAGTGNLAAYLPGRTSAGVAGEIVSASAICDDAWHYLAMTMDASDVKLYLDGKLVMESDLQGVQMPAVAGDLAFGQLVEGGFNCNGLIDDVRISKGLRAIPGTPPKAPFSRGPDTLGLWNFDDKITAAEAGTAMDRLTASSSNSRR